eukprot:4391702-Amphidinium_carterae.1
MDEVLDEAVSALQHKDTFLASVHAFGARHGHWRLESNAISFADEVVATARGVLPESLQMVLSDWRLLTDKLVTGIALRLRFYSRLQSSYCLDEAGCHLQSC